MRFKHIVLVVAALVVMAGFLVFVHRFMQVDQCVKAGGQWNWTASACE